MGTMINGVTHPVHATTQATTRNAAPSIEEARPTDERPGQADTLELSLAARERLDQNRSAPIRAELVERVRAEIAAGEYLTDEKIDAVVNRLHRDMIVAA